MKKELALLFIFGILFALNVFGGTEDLSKDPNVWPYILTGISLAGIIAFILKRDYPLGTEGFLIAFFWYIWISMAAICMVVFILLGLKEGIIFRSILVSFLALILGIVLGQFWGKKTFN